MITIYYNPKCSKCRQTLALLQEKTDEEINIIEYLKTPPSIEELQQILQKLNLNPQEIIRKGEEEFQEFKGKEFSDKEWIQILHDHPKLIQRPIVIINEKAVIARPPENVLKILQLP